MQDDSDSYSIDQWCDRRGFSRGTFYNLERRGQAPRTFRVGTRRIISKTADEEWLREREAAEPEESAHFVTVEPRSRATSKSCRARDNCAAPIVRKMARSVTVGDAGLNPTQESKDRKKLKEKPAHQGATRSEENYDC